MYDPVIWIEKDVYAFLVKWCLSIGYELKTNEPHTIIYGITCYDRVRVQELKEEGKHYAYTREEAESLVNDLKKHLQNGGEPFTPDYDPPIRIRDDFSTEVFLPTLTGSAEKPGNYEVEYEQWGIYHKIKKVILKEDGPVMDRTVVMCLIRGLEYDAVMPDFIVGYNLLRDRGSMSIAWTSEKLKNNKAAQELMAREKKRHQRGDWRIYRNVTDIAAEEELPFPPAYVSSEGWLWLRVEHPKIDYHAAYGEQGFYNDLCEVRMEIVRIREEDMYAICGIYACVHHDPLPVAEPEEKEEEKATPEQTKLLNEQMTLLKERLTLLEMIQGELGNDVALYLQALDEVVNTKMQTAPGSHYPNMIGYYGDLWVKGCRSGMAIALDILTLKIEDVTIGPNLPNRPIRIGYYEHVQERHVLDKTIILEEEEDHGSGEDQ